MCGGGGSKKPAEPAPAPPPVSPGYQLDSGGVIRDAPKTVSSEGQAATFGSELATGAPT